MLIDALQRLGRFQLGCVAIRLQAKAQLDARRAHL
jgi:hypothetical protein